MITTQNRRGVRNSKTSHTPHRSPLSKDEIFDEYVVRRIQFQANRVAKQIHLDDWQREDVMQNMSVEIFKAARRFDPTRASWHTFASRVLNISARRFRCDEIRRRKRYRRDVSISSCNQSRNEFLVLDNTTQIDLRCDIEDILKKMPPRLRKVCELLMILSPSETARSLGIHRSSIYPIIKKIKVYFEDDFGEFSKIQAAN